MLAVILAAGKGTRLLPLTENTPKTLVNICDKTLMVRILEALPDQVTRIVIVVGYLGEKIEAAIGTEWKGTPVAYVTQVPLDGTATALRLTESHVDGKFLVVNGDDIYAKRDLEHLIGHDVGILVQHTPEQIPTSALLNEQGCLEGLEKDPPAHEPHIRVCGAYILDERFFKYAPVTVDVRGTTEYGLPHTLVAMSKDICVKAEEATFWIPVGTPDELSRARLRCVDKK